MGWKWVFVLHGVAQAKVALPLCAFCSLGNHDKGDGERSICCSPRLFSAQHGREHRAGWREASLSASASRFPLGTSTGCVSVNLD